MLQKAEEGHIVNTSSINGFWASVGPRIPRTAYSAAKFAVKGFTEALIADCGSMRRISNARSLCPVRSGPLSGPTHAGTTAAIANRMRLMLPV
jgi:NAD(P)-dependent dehydrogenase (short-subunit alcohol dehydrogenase family)